MKNEARGHFKRVAIKIILIAATILMAIILIIPLAAEIKFNYAQKLADGYLWEKAEKQFSEVIRIDPFNASYFAGYGDFLRSIAPYKEDEASLLSEAQKLYGRASQLDPLNARYFSRAGAIKLRLFLLDRDKHKEGFRAGLDDLKKALLLDPNGFNVSYEVGYWGIEAWPYLDGEFKRLVVDRLRYILSQKRWYWEQIYPWAWQNTNDFEILESIAPKNETAHEDLLYFLESSSLCQFRRREADEVDFYMKKEEPEKFFKKEREKAGEIEKLKKEFRDKLESMEIGENLLSSSVWHGKSDDGKNEFKDGAMYWSGTMSTVMRVPKGPVALVIQTKGTPADGVYPYMVVELDGEEVGEAFVNNADWKEYSFPLKSSGGIKVLSITYVNDAVDVKKNEDRNLFIGEARVISDAR